jgi:hypothetical protein
LELFANRVEVKSVGRRNNRQAKTSQTLFSKTLSINTGARPIRFAHREWPGSGSAALKDYLTQNGGAVTTGVTLNAINGTTAVADMIVKLPPLLRSSSK